MKQMCVNLEVIIALLALPPVRSSPEFDPRVKRQHKYAVMLHICDGEMLYSTFQTCLTRTDAFALGRNLTAYYMEVASTC